jgi:diadenosine tetraphosphatase ApaH/serine/threonine PP2A family protein phosphatase
MMMSRDQFTMQLTEGTRYLVNPGSIGQPRDHNPKASYAIFDPHNRTLELHRVGYDVERAQARIEAEGLPGVLAARLALGV